MNIARLILLPLVPFYFLVFKLHSLFYRLGILRTHSFDIPVIKVGNILTGGTGKTPLTAYLAEYFANAGLKVAIVSRGYKKSTAGNYTILNKGEITANISEAGDELFMLARQFSESHLKNKITIIADSNRARSIKTIETNKLGDVVILDDAFQNYSVVHDFNIVIKIPARNIFDKILLPAGNLRECISGLSRSDIVICNLKFSKLNEFCKGKVTFGYKVEMIKNIYGHSPEVNEVTLISGIGDPDSFRDAVRSAGFSITNYYDFRDHFNYNFTDIEHILNRYKCILTTEKDFNKIVSLPQVENFEDKIYFVRIELNFLENYSILKNKLDEIIEKSSKH